jgi:prephenate dehydrogenase
MTPDVTRAVVGLGLVGGSIALALGARGYDREPGAREGARRRGIDARDTLSEAVADADIIVAAVSTQETAPLLVELSSAASRAVLTDTASLKRPVVEAAQRLRADVRFVGGHPMAGSHRSGVDAASADLFRGRPWILCRTARTDEASLAKVSALVRAAGARPVLLDAKRHDELMTWASHLPLAVASALAKAAARGGGPQLRDVAGPGLLDTTRVAGQPASLGLELAFADPAALAAAIEAVSGELTGLASALRAGDAEAARAFLEEAAEARLARFQPRE